MQFNLRAIFIVVTILAIPLGIGAWIWREVQFREDVYSQFANRDLLLDRYEQRVTRGGDFVPTSLAKVVAIQLNEIPLTNSELAAVGEFTSLEKLVVNPSGSQSYPLPKPGGAPRPDLENILPESFASWAKLEKLAVFVSRPGDRAINGLKYLRCGKTLRVLDLNLVQGVGHMLAQGATREEVLQDIPTLDKESIAAIANFPDLFELDLSGWKIDESAAKAIGNMRNLTVLHLGFTSITDRELKILLQSPQLQQLDLRGTLITDVGVAELARCPVLIKLDLSRTDITDASCPTLARLPALNYFRASHTKISDAGVVDHLVHSRIETLEVGGPAISDRTIGALLEMKSLKHSDAWGPSVTAEAVARLNAKRPPPPSYMDPFEIDRGLGEGK